MGSSGEDETLTFEVKLTDIQRLVIHCSRRAGGKLEAIRDALDNGLAHCLSHGQQQSISNLIDDLKSFQQNWCQNVCFLKIDADQKTCHLHLTAIREAALQLMLSNKVTSRLKNSHFLVPQPPVLRPTSPPTPPVPRLRTKPPKPPKPPKPSRPPKSPSLMHQKAPAGGRLKAPESSESNSAGVDALRPGNFLSASASSVATSDTTASDMSDINENGHSTMLDLRKTFYCDDALVGPDGIVVSDADVAAVAAATAAAQNFECKNALEELIATEKKYIRRMDLLSNHYYPRVSSELPHLVDKLKEIFLDFDTFRQLHQELLKELEQVSQEAGGELQRCCLGPVMAKYGHHLLLYSGYYTKYKLHLNQISEWKREEAINATFLRARGECPEMADRMLDVTSHMLEPVQRPLRYPMLMARYLKEIGEQHPDYPSAKRALEIIEKVTDSFNVKMSEVESLQKLLAILSDVAFPAELQAEKEKFICSQYLLSAKVLKISSKNRQQIRFLILSSSMLLLCEVKALWKTVQRIVSVDKSLVLTLDEKLSADYPNCFRLRTLQKTYDFSFPTLDDFDKWIAAFRKLNVTFGDSNSTNEKFPWKTFEDDDLGNKQPMKLKDRDVSQCQACAAIFTLTRRRHHCRLCGGIFCGSCSKYTCAVAWATDELKRACFFCRNRVNRRDKTNSPLDARHRELIEKFNKSNEGSEVRIQGYLNVRIEVQQAKKEKAPSFLQVHWCKMWCTVEGELFNIYRMKNDFVPAHNIVLPMNLSVELAEDASEVRLRVADISVCRLRMTAEAGMRSAEREASHLQEWFDILKNESQIFSGQI